MPNVTIQNGRYTIDDPLYQWDSNKVLEIRGLSLPSVPEIHFTNTDMNRAIVVQSNMNAAGVITVDVPNSLLQKPYTITVYVCMRNGDYFESLYKIDLPVKARKQPGDYSFVDNVGEVYSFNALESKLDKTLKESIENYNNAKNAYEDLINSGKTIETYTNEAISDIVESGDTEKEKIQQFANSLTIDDLMRQADYDPQNKILEAGNIPKYVDNYVGQLFDGGDLIFDTEDYATINSDINIGTLKGVWVKVGRLVFIKIYFSVTFNNTVYESLETPYITNLLTPSSFGSSSNSTSFGSPRNNIMCLGSMYYSNGGIRIPLKALFNVDAFNANRFCIVLSPWELAKRSGINTRTELETGGSYDLHVSGIYIVD